MIDELELAICTPVAVNEQGIFDVRPTVDKYPGTFFRQMNEPDGEWMRAILTGFLIS
jgi:hypothetical protein